MLRLRNGDGLTEEPGAMSSLRFIQGIDLITIGSCSFQWWDSWVMQPWWFFSCNDYVSGHPLAARSKVLGEKRWPPRCINSQIVADECGVNSVTTGVLRFGAPVFDGVIQILQQNPVQIKPCMQADTRMRIVFCVRAKLQKLQLCQGFF